MLAKTPVEPPLTIQPLQLYDAIFIALSNRFILMPDDEKDEIAREIWETLKARAN